MTQEIGNSELLDTWASGGTIVEPNIDKIISGWGVGERPPSQFFNWLQNNFGSKINHVLKNGIPQWNAVTSYSAGDIAKRNGIIYTALVANAGSQPPSGQWVAYARLTDIVPLSRLITAGNGLTGGGNLSGNRTFTLGTPSTVTLSTQNAVTENSHTHALNIPNGSTSQAGLVQLVNSSSNSSINLAPTAAALQATQNFAETRAAASIVITAGNGLTGGGNLGANRTINMGTPSTLDGSTDNSASGNTHTHNISTTSSRTSSSTALLLNAAGMNNHRTSGDHDGRYYTRAESDNTFQPAPTTSTNGNLTNFPVGTILSAFSAGTTSYGRNADVTVRLGSSGVPASEGFQIGGSGSVLAGTWRTRGVCFIASDRFYLVQRVS
jgi:hypothetical protein